MPPALQSGSSTHHALPPALLLGEGFMKCQCIALQGQNFGQQLQACLHACIGLTSNMLSVAEEPLCCQPRKEILVVYAMKKLWEVHEEICSLLQ